MIHSSLVPTVLITLLFLSRNSSTHVKVFHLTIDYWRVGVEGEQHCGSNITCDWNYAADIKRLRHQYMNSTLYSASGLVKKNLEEVVTVSVYNIHFWAERSKKHGPALCELPTNLNVAESEESRVRFHGTFDQTFKNFDGFSTTHPSSSIQRVYDSAYLNHSLFLNDGELYNFTSLIKAAAYVAGDCHRRDNANSNRDHIIHEIRKAGYRVEGLGRCMHTNNPEGISLPTNSESRYDMVLKRKSIGRYLFTMAFENSIEEGYVTEKPFDALLAGSVPVYLGDKTHLKALLPHPDAAIFIADYNGNYTRLVEYLNYLSTNETAYESHRAWRKDFSYEVNIRDKPLLQSSWYCAVCRWAAANPHLQQTREERLKTCASVPPEE